ncbi:MAG: 4Fe-4S dicluster domain-containing protein [Candidatus Woesearchaeota archaeon]|jgi:ferredoxin
MTYSDDLYAISYDKFKELVNKLCKNTSVFGPKLKKITSFEKIKNANELSLDKASDFPLKYLFFSDNEILFEFNGQEIKIPKINSEEKVIIGARRCDLNSITKQDKAFNNKFVDEYYNKRRENTTFIGLHCVNGMDEHCFCESLTDKDSKELFDIMLYPRSDHYLVEVGSKKGEELLQKYKDFFEKSSYKLKPEDKIMNTNRLKTTNIAPLFTNKGWEDLAKKCTSCGACNLMCPSCYCFDILDTVNFDLKSGTRIRKPASCQMRCFTRLAGEGHFRDKKLERYKHRIYHQLQHFSERHGTNLCTGCGRCIRHCPNKIEFVNKINEMSGAK